VSTVKFTSAQARKSYVADVEEPIPLAHLHGATKPIRPTLEETAGKPESSPAEPAGPVPVPAALVVITTSEGGRGISRPEGFPFPGISLGCPGGQAGPTSIDWSPRPPSEWGTRPPPGLATDNDFYQTASSDSDVAATVQWSNHQTTQAQQQQT